MSRLVYREAAESDWEKALPIGCGKLGAMIFGEPFVEHYQLNEDTVWFGGAMDRINPDAKANLEKVRNLIFDGKIPEAERLLKFAFSGTPQSERSYQTLGDLYIDMMKEVPIENYERTLDLEQAVHMVRYKDEDSDITYNREVFASAVRNCIVTRITADADKSVSAAAKLGRDGFCDSAWHEMDTAFMSGSLGCGGSEFCAGIKMLAKNAEIHAIGEHLIAENADEILIFFTAGTTYRYADARQYVKKCLEECACLDYVALKEEHVKDYQSYFNRVRFTLGESESDCSDINVKEPDHKIMKAYFDFGRYLLISCSRPGSLPANLQGIWNRDYCPAWGSKYTININTEMNYWPAEMMGLSELHLPLFDMLERMEENGRKTAKEMYGCRGFVAHHNTDIWADTAPQDIYTPATVWPMGGAWLCTHVWLHYDYTRDLEFLKRMYPTVKQSVAFFLDYLVKFDGYYVTTPSVSPENTYILPDGTSGCVCFGPTMDSQILRDLFSQFLNEAVLVDETDQEFVKEVKEVLAKLPPNRIGKEGRLLEWFYEYDEAEPGHRHISHLYGLHPSYQIRMVGDEKQVRAARETLQCRLANGGGHTGWSRAWIMNMYARLWDGEACYENFVQLLKNSTLPNLLDNHPPFQIDGNFGAVSAIGEMLLQSVENEVILLPALPKQWKEGAIEGIRARGRARYNIYWKNGKLVEFAVVAEEGYHALVRYKEKCWHIDCKSGTLLNVRNDINEFWNKR